MKQLQLSGSVYYGGATRSLHFDPMEKLREMFPGTIFIKVGSYQGVDIFVPDPPFEGKSPCIWMGVGNPDGIDHLTVKL